jgi:hypothetical protein
LEQEKPVTGDTIYLFTKNKKADLIKYSKQFSYKYERRRRLQPGKIYPHERFFTNGSMDSVLAKGAAESIYFIQDKDSAYTGINQTASVDMHVYFAKEILKRLYLFGT